MLNVQMQGQRLFVSGLLLATLGSCGDPQSSEVKDIVNTGAGVFDRHSIVERDRNISDDSKVGHIEGLNFFPTTLPKTNPDQSSRFGEDVFWTYEPGTRISIKADPQKVLPDQLLMEAEVAVGKPYPTGGFYHDEFATFVGVTANWKVEFQPHLRVRGGSSGAPVQLKAKEHWVCSSLGADGTIAILREQVRDFRSEPVAVRSSFQDLKVAFEVSSGAYLNFKGSCDSQRGQLAHYIEFTLTGAEGEARSVQFVELRVIKEQQF